MKILGFVVTLVLGGCTKGDPDGPTDGDGDGIPATADCDDADPAIGAASPLFPDADGDGYGTEAGETRCLEDGWAETPGDCADSDAGIYPGAIERCNAADDD